MLSHMTNDDPAPDLATHVRAEIRAHLARTDITRGQLAEQIDVSSDWVARRLAGTVGVTLEDLQRIADGLGINPRRLLP